MRLVPVYLHCYSIRLGQLLESVRILQYNMNNWVGVRSCVSTNRRKISDPQILIGRGPWCLLGAFRQPWAVSSNVTNFQWEFVRLQARDWNSFMPRLACRLLLKVTKAGTPMALP